MNSETICYPFIDLSTPQLFGFILAAVVFGGLVLDALRFVIDFAADRLKKR